MELGRNVPILLQLLFWYSLVTKLGGPRTATELLPGVYLSNRGLQLPALVHTATSWTTVAALLSGLTVLGLLLAWRRATGRRYGLSIGPALMLTLLGALVGGGISGASVQVQVPELRGFNFEGGITVSAESTALLFGLTFYTGAFVAEIVRGGIVSVPKGQWEASKALGLPDHRTFAKVILPHVVRAILPPLTNQYINLAKNTSVAVAIGYPDLTNVANTSINQTGRAVQIVLVLMAFYLMVSLSISALAGWYGRRLEPFGSRR